MTKTEEKPDVVSHESIVDALAAAQAEFPAIAKDQEAKIKTRSGGEYSYRYATLDAVLSACRPVLARHGLAISWVFKAGENRGTVITKLLWKEEKLESELPAYGGEDMQSLGSAITYAKRYGLCGLIGVTAEEDDDGANAGTRPKASPRQQPSQQQAPPAKEEEPTCPGIEVWKKKIATKEKPEDMLAFVKSMSSYEPLTSQKELCEQVFDAVADAVRAKQEEWGEQPTGLVRQLLQSKLQALDIEWQAKETFG